MGAQHSVSSSAPIVVGRGRVREEYKVAPRFRFVTRADVDTMFRGIQTTGEPRTFYANKTLPVDVKRRLASALKKSKTVRMNSKSMLVATRDMPSGSADDKSRMYSLELTGETNQHVQVAIPVLMIHVMVGESARQSMATRIARAIEWQGIPVYSWNDQHELAVQSDGARRRSTTTFMNAFQNVLRWSRKETSESLMSLLVNQEDRVRRLAASSDLDAASVSDVTKSHLMRVIKAYQRSRADWDDDTPAVDYVKSIATCLAEASTPTRLMDADAPIIELVALAASHDKLGLYGHPFSVRLRSAVLRRLRSQVCNEAKTFREMCDYVMNVYQSLPWSVRALSASRRELEWEIAEKTAENKKRKQQEKAKTDAAAAQKPKAQNKVQAQNKPKAQVQAQNKPKAQVQAQNKPKAQEQNKPVQASANLSESSSPSPSPDSSSSASSSRPSQTPPDSS